MLRPIELFRLQFLFTLIIFERLFNGVLLTIDRIERLRPLLRKFRFLHVFVFYWFQEEVNVAENVQVEKVIHNEEQRRP